MACAASVAAQTAETSPEFYALAWVRGDGAKDCPAATELQQEIEWRVGRRVFEPTASRSIEASVRRDSATSIRRSEIHVRDADGKTLGRRTLESQEGDCRSLFSSTALAIALVVDPAASTAPRSSVTAPMRAAGPTQRPNASIGATQSATLSSGAEADSLMVAPAVPRTDAAARTARPIDASSSPIPSAPLCPPQTYDGTTNKPTSQMVASGLIATGILPSIQPGVAVTLRTWTTKVVGWSLSAHYLHHASSDVVAGSSVAVGLTSLEAALDLELFAGESVRLLADLGPAVGALQIAVRGTPAAGPTERLFLAGRAGVAMQLKLQDKLFLELGLTALLPWLQSRLVHSDARQTEIWRQPSLGGTGRIGLGVAFP